MPLVSKYAFRLLRSKLKGPSGTAIVGTCARKIATRNCHCDRLPQLLTELVRRWNNNDGIYGCTRRISCVHKLDNAQSL